MQHPSFEGLETTPGGVSWSGEIELEGAPVPVDLSSDGLPTTAQLDVAASFVQEVARFDQAARASLASSDELAESATLYLEHHASELSRAQHLAAFGTSDPNELTRALLVRRLELIQIGLHPDDPACTATFEYMLPGEVSDYVLAVSFDEAGEITAIEMES